MRVLAVIGGVLLFIGLCVGGWFLYWGVTAANTDQQYHVNTNSQQYQGALVQQERDRVAGYDNATSDAQKKNIAETFCAVYSDLTNPPTDLAEAQARICN